MGRKTRSDAVLLNLPEDRQEQIIEWCETPKSESCPGGYQFAREQLQAGGLKVSLRAIGDFYSSWHLQQDLSLARQVENTINSAGPGKTKLAREAGESMLLGLSLAKQDAKLFTAASMSIDSRRQLDLKETDLQLKESKFQRDTCKLFLKWSEDETAKKIASGSGSQADKIEALGRHMFGESWDE